MDGSLPFQTDDKCNFSPKVVQRITYIHGANSKKVIACYLDIEEAGPTELFEVALDQLETFHWETVSEQCCFDYHISPATLRRYIANLVRRQLPNTPLKKIYQVDHVGTHIIAGKPIFCAGKEIIRPSDSSEDSPEIVSLVEGKQLEVDPSMTEDEAIVKVFDLISVNPTVISPILLQTLCYLMRQAYEDVGKPPCICLFLYGPSGTFKTTIASFLTQLYNRKEGIKSPSRLNASSSAAAMMLRDAWDEVVVLDDLCPDPSNDIRKQQEETLIEVTRYIGDGTLPARLKGNKMWNSCIHCGVLFTGEYLIGTGSDAARILPVEIQRTDGIQLKYFQDHPLILSTFYYNFIRWYLTNYSEIVTYLKKWLDHYSNTEFSVHNRLKETHFFLLTTHAILISYCVEKGVLEKADALKLNDDFLVLLNSMIDSQNQRVKHDASGTASVEEPVDYSSRLRAYYQQEAFNIASRVADFQETVHDGVLHHHKLYLRRESLASLFSEELDCAIEQWTQNNLLEVGKTSKTKQISKLRGKRFYVFPLAKLK